MFKINLYKRPVPTPSKKDYIHIEKLKSCHSNNMENVEKWITNQYWPLFVHLGMTTFFEQTVQKRIVLSQIHIE